jgi:hypothetical protein
MNTIRPRFEFRCFSSDLAHIHSRMRQISPLEKIRETAEIYIISATNNLNNTKIRDNLMDIKVFVQENMGYEQWNPLMKGQFPMTAAQLKEDVLPAFAVAPMKLSQESYTLPAFLNEVVHPHRELLAMNVFKRRFAFTINACIAEFAEVYINGARLETAAIESTEVNDIAAACRETGLDNYENVNYLRALKRVSGLEALAPNDIYRTRIAEG